MVMPRVAEVTWLVGFAQLVDRKYEWKNIEATLTEHNRIRVQVPASRPTPCPRKLKYVWQHYYTIINRTC